MGFPNNRTDRFILTLIAPDRQQTYPTFLSSWQVIRKLNGENYGTDNIAIDTVTHLLNNHNSLLNN